MHTLPPNAWRELHDFWFRPEPPLSPPDRMKRWFVADRAFDEALRRFEPWLEADVPSSWRESPQGTLAVVLLYDQLPRNLYRGTGRAFAWDARALAESKAAIARGDDRAVEPLERGFFYLPFEHDETTASQDESVRLFEALLPEFPKDQQKLGDIYLDFAKKHQDVIRRYGRFPHRNAALGRISTADECLYLAQPGAGF